MISFGSCLRVQAGPGSPGEQRTILDGFWCPEYESFGIDFIDLKTDACQYHDPRVHEARHLIRIDEFLCTLPVKLELARRQRFQLIWWNPWLKGNAITLQHTVHRMFRNRRKVHKG